MRKRLLTDWHAMRWMRLAFAIVFVFAGIAQHEPVAYSAAAFFGIQALLNVGCCGAACATPRRPRRASTTRLPRGRQL
ncbi:MAG: hypothetical protein IPK99_09040 [Flavobacteriales bacterium]|nr:hypothetical protein [Flavobacteriales bacterium]